MTILHTLRFWQELLFAFTRKEFKRRYKQRYLKAAWTVLHPLFTLLIFITIFSRVAKLPSEQVPYALFSFTALIFWSYLAACVNSSTNALLSNSQMITRLRFPRMVIPFATVLANFPDFLISVVLLVLFLAFNKVGVSPHLAFLVPIFLAQLLTTFGAALILSIANVYMRDIQSALPILIQAWMLISPVGYSLSMVGKPFRPFYLLNPMAGILDSYRKVLIHHELPDAGALLTAEAVSVILFVTGLVFFQKLEKNVADVI